MEEKIITKFIEKFVSTVFRLHGEIEPDICMPAWPPPRIPPRSCVRAMHVLQDVAAFLDEFFVRGAVA